MKKVRILGFVTLIAGFIWLCLYSITITGPTARAVTSKQLELIATQESKISYSKEEVRSFVVTTASEYHDSIPRLIVPAIVMLLGGMLIFISGQYKELEQP